MLLVLQRVRDSPESQRDGVSGSSQERLIEVLERSVVSDLGIHLRYRSESQELDSPDIIIEQSAIRESTE